MNLEGTRKFYLTYQDRISQTLFEELLLKNPKQCLMSMDSECAD